MSATRLLRQHLHGLQEIEDILNSMKTLAAIETRKLTRYATHQERCVAGIERAAADFYRHFPHHLEPSPGSVEVCLLLGSERGFCGDFNERLIAALDEPAFEARVGNMVIVAVGSRLIAKLEGDPRVVTPLPGPSAAEEIPLLLDRTVDTIAELEQRYGSLALTVFHHATDTHSVVSQRLLPPFHAFSQAPSAFGYPPRIQLPAGQLLAELVDQYLFARLNQCFYANLLAENQRRMRHLEGAVQRLEDKIGRLRQRSNTLRQEEITEEIEVLLISAQSQVQ